MINGPQEAKTLVEHSDSQGLWAPTRCLCWCSFRLTIIWISSLKNCGNFPLPFKVLLWTDKQAFVWVFPQGLSLANKGSVAAHGTLLTWQHPKSAPACYWLVALLFLTALLAVGSGGGMARGYGLFRHWRCPFPALLQRFHGGQQNLSPEMHRRLPMTGQGQMRDWGNTQTIR